ncbi:MAG: hypothetical protein H5T64_08890 [Chloroflexi bacterium]|nr:hypothetical protein [Chloroflexota bacterium]
MERLGAEYSRQQLLILEYDLAFNYQLGQSRLAYYAGSFDWPNVMVDGFSGHITGYQPDYYAAYRPLIEAELSRPSPMDIAATRTWEGNQLALSVIITPTCSSTIENAQVFFAIYTQRKVAMTPFYALQVIGPLPAGSLVPGLRNTYSALSEPVSAEDRSLVEAIAFVQDPVGAQKEVYQATMAFEAPPRFVVCLPVVMKGSAS